MERCGMRFVWNEGRHIKIGPKDYKTADPWGDIPGALQIAGLRPPKGWRRYTETACEKTDHTFGRPTPAF